ncbi:MAG: ChuX/HutX family heme-like substrate-binding protein [Emcibacteraceae bacterium]
MDVALASDETSYMQDLKEKWHLYKEENPKVRIRNAADDLGVSEAELVATGIGETAVRLKAEWGNIIKQLPKLGEILCITRNDDAVHEKNGKFGAVSVSPGHALVVNREIDLRIFFSHWHFGFAVTENTARGERKSLQFFDLSGSSVHKVYLTDDSNFEAYDELISRFKADNQYAELKTTEHAPLPAEVPDENIEAERMRKHWLALQDTHDFIHILRDFGVSRVQALRLAGSDLAFEVSKGAFRYALEKASQTGLPIMIFVGNKGCIQIHTGPIKRIVDSGGWLNILDPRFDLHVKESRIEKAWVVRKPTSDGIVTSLELFDKDGNQILTMFGERKPGQPELKDWAALCADLPK